jgi:hypothetical protein
MLVVVYFGRKERTGIAGFQFDYKSLKYNHFVPSHSTLDISFGLRNVVRWRVDAAVVVCLRVPACVRER